MTMMIIEHRSFVSFSCKLNRLCKIWLHFLYFLSVNVPLQGRKSSTGIFNIQLVFVVFFSFHSWNPLTMSMFIKEILFNEQDKGGIFNEANPIDQSNVLIHSSLKRNIEHKWNISLFTRHTFNRLFHFVLFTTNIDKNIS